MSLPEQPTGRRTGARTQRLWMIAALALAGVAGGGALLFAQGNGAAGHARCAGGEECEEAAGGGGGGGGRAGSSEVAAKVMKAGKGGIVHLAPGNYGEAVFKNVNAPGVVVTSANPASPAIFTGIFVRNSSGIRFENIRLDARVSVQKFPIMVVGSRGIGFTGLDATGEGTGLNPKSVSAMMIRNSSDVAVENSRIRLFWHGISMLASQRVRISGNELRDLRTDGIRGGGLSDTVIENNFITDFRPAEGDHPDGIQLWSVQQKEGSRNIVIRDNAVVRGRGDAAQGIFINEQVGTMPYTNMTITGNLVLGGRFNGISLIHVNGVKIEDNIVSGLPDRLSWIRLEKATGGSVAGNKAMKFTYEANSGIANSRNEVIGAASLDEAQRRLLAWVAAHPASRAAKGPLGAPLLAADKVGPLVTSGVNPDQRERMKGRKHQY